MEVKTLEEKAFGKYGLFVEHLRSSTIDDKNRISAERAFADGLLLRKNAYNLGQQNQTDKSTKTFRQSIAKLNEARKYWVKNNDLDEEMLAVNEIAYIYYLIDAATAVSSAREVLTFYRITKKYESEFNLIDIASRNASLTWQKNIGIEFAEDLLLFTKTTKELNSPLTLAYALNSCAIVYGNSGRKRKGIQFNLKSLDIY